MSNRMGGWIKDVVTLALAFAALYVARTYRGNYLLFHSLAEIFSIVVAYCIFVVAWNSRRLTTNSYLLFLGGASLFVGAVDLLHTLAFRGMGVFPQADANLPTQLWIVARYLQAAALLVAPLFLKRRLRLSGIMLACSLATAVLLGLVFAGGFPDCLVRAEAQAAYSLTPFKRISEYVICLTLAFAMLHLWSSRQRLDRDVLHLLLGSLVVTIGSELCFTLYTDPTGPFNFAGHYLKILAFFLIYKAVVETGLARPYQLLFRDLARSEAALRESEERYRTLVELSPRAILVHSEGRYVYANPAAARLFGAADPGQLVGRGVLDLVHPEDRDAVVARLTQLRQAGARAGAGEARIVRLDGQPVTVEAVAAHVTYRQCPAVQVLLEDITERKAAERLLRQAKASAEAANQAKDHFLATLSHELRTPLTPVLVAASVLRDDPSIPQRARNDLDMIRRNVELQARLIDDLLDLTRIARGKLELCLRTISVHDVINHAMEICRSDVNAKEIRLAADLRATCFHAKADAARLQQVFWNLLKNATKFTAPGGRVTIRTSKGEGAASLVIQIQDTGMGIEPDDLPRIFDAFEQGGRQVTRRFGGLGLGLAICKAVVDVHGGTIRAASAGRDKGATFTVTLPVADGRSPIGQPDSGAPGQPSRTGDRRLRILLVEDHSDTAYLMSRLLERMSHDVKTAASVQDAMTVARAGSFDLVISDLGLPDGSGLDLMRQLSTMYGLKGICLSGYGMERDIQASHDAGFVQHLVKPVDVQNLRTAIRYAVDTTGQN